MSDFRRKHVSRPLMSRQLMSSHLKKKMSKATHETPTHNHLDGTIDCHILPLAVMITEEV